MLIDSQAYGGPLVDQLLTGKALEAARQKCPELPALVVDDWTISDLEMIAVGAFSPLRGFMGQADYESVVHRKRLSSGLPWTIPVTLAVEANVADRAQLNEDWALTDETGAPWAVLTLRERYRVDRGIESEAVYGTRELQHPGVARVMRLGEWRLSGPIGLLRRPAPLDYGAHLIDPKESRRRFSDRGWRTVVGFQTRNPVHRAHEYIQKCAMEMVDGLFLQPLVGRTKDDDIPMPVRMRCYEALLESYYPADRVILGVLPAAMRYAGPREAIFHAIVRKNYGCTHFIVGRDHAGVGNYYGSFDAHRIFEQFDPGELGITPLFFDHTFYCGRCDNMTSSKTCPHPPENRLILSGTQIRTMLRNGDPIPREFSRPEVAEILRQSVREADA
ncbi:MAG: sulfate adenylyltransferase [Acidobacteria bacterium]|nr:sulfate adenylyltransferase [Acidobacteriota bacterium]